MILRFGNLDLAPRINLTVYARFYGMQLHATKIKWNMIFLLVCLDLAPITMVLKLQYSKNVPAHEKWSYWLNHLKVLAQIDIFIVIIRCVVLPILRVMPSMVTVHALDPYWWAEDRTQIIRLLSAGCWGTPGSTRHARKDTQTTCYWAELYLRGSPNSREPMLEYWIHWRWETVPVLLTGTCHYYRVTLNTNISGVS